MHIQLETPSKNTIRSYTSEHVTIDTHKFTQSVIIGKDTIVNKWPVYSLQELNETSLAPLLNLKPEIIIIGHQQSNAYLPITVIEYLSRLRIGIECMSLGAACRTFNLLLDEQRKVVVGIIFETA